MGIKIEKHTYYYEVIQEGNSIGDIVRTNGGWQFEPNKTGRILLSAVEMIYIAERIQKLNS